MNNQHVCVPTSIMFNKKMNNKSIFLLAIMLRDMDENFNYVLNIEEYQKEKHRYSLKVNDSINRLHEAGYIINNKSGHSESEIVYLLQNKKLNGFGVGNKTCEWCNIKTFSIHSHHHPIPKSLGGTDTVDICSNCHFEFHYMKNASFIKHIKITLLSQEERDSIIKFKKEQALLINKENK